ncbi:hypothetical protein E2C01_101934 [Portunus trituberculatus]|uniref:Uncharacterized protein n=1 Tax=Portunus trituberculatus TaxID=210409 RepID=A0A5B7KH25_PORTR|nr:hypothetical protein [Portunus trituberculatus]
MHLLLSSAHARSLSPCVARPCCGGVGVRGTWATSTTTTTTTTTTISKINKTLKITSVTLRSPVGNRTRGDMSCLAERRRNMTFCFVLRCEWGGKKGGRDVRTGGGGGGGGDGGGGGGACSKGKERRVRC